MMPSKLILLRIVWTLVAVVVILLGIIVADQALGQIEVASESPIYHPILVEVEAQIPTDGRVIRTGPGWILSPGLNAQRISETKIVVCGAPGEYTIGYKINYIALEKVTFTDGDGHVVTFWSYISHGEYDTETTFKILGGDDDIPIPPGPLPGGKYRIMMFYNTSLLDNYSRGQRLILTSLKVRENIKSLGHNVLELHDLDRSPGSIPERFVPWHQSISDDTEFPRIALAPIKKSGKILDYPLPVTEKALMELLK